MAEGVCIHRLELVKVDAQGTIGSNHIWVVYDLAAHVPLSPEWVAPETDCIPEIGMYSVGLGVHEIDAHVVGGHADNVELDKLQVLETGVIGNVSALVGKRLKCFTVWNGHRAITKRDRPRGVQRVHPHRVPQFGDVVDAVVIDVGRVGDEKLFHPVMLLGERGQLLGQRCCAVFAQGHRDRKLSFGVQGGPHVEHEIFLGGGLDDSGNGLYLYRRRRRGLLADRTSHD